MICTPSFLPLGGVKEQVAEVARPFALFKRLAHVVVVFLIVGRVVDVHDEARVAAVEVVAAAEQDGEFVEPDALQVANVVQQHPTSLAELNSSHQVHQCAHQ